MRSTILEKSGIVGFGLTRDEALNDWKINSYIRSSSFPSNPIYIERRDTLSPWLPMPDLFHIAGVGCLQYKDGVITNLSTGKSVKVTSYDLTQFYYFSVLLGDSLSFEDITIVCRDKVNEFFSNISQSFIPIEEFPIIKLSNEFTGFTPNVTMITNNDVILGYDNAELGMKKSSENEDYFYSVQYSTPDQIVPLLSYIGYKIDIIIDDKGVYAL